MLRPTYVEVNRKRANAEKYCKGTSCSSVRFSGFFLGISIVLLLCCIFNIDSSLVHPKLMGGYGEPRVSFGRLGTFEFEDVLYFVDKVCLLTGSVVGAVFLDDLRANQLSLYCRLIICSRLPLLLIVPDGFSCLTGALIIGTCSMVKGLLVVLSVSILYHTFHASERIFMLGSWYVYWSDGNNVLDLISSHLAPPGSSAVWKYLVITLNLALVFSAVTLWLFSVDPRPKSSQLFFNKFDVLYGTSKQTRMLSVKGKLHSIVKRPTNVYLFFVLCLSAFPLVAGQWYLGAYILDQEAGVTDAIVSNLMAILAVGKIVGSLFGGCVGQLIYNSTSSSRQWYLSLWMALSFACSSIPVSLILRASSSQTICSTASALNAYLSIKVYFATIGFLPTMSSTCVLPLLMNLSPPSTQAMVAGLHNAASLVGDQAGILLFSQFLVTASSSSLSTESLRQNALLGRLFIAIWFPPSIMLLVLGKYLRKDEDSIQQEWASKMRARQEFLAAEERLSEPSTVSSAELDRSSLFSRKFSGVPNGSPWESDSPIRQQQQQQQTEENVYLHQAEQGNGAGSDLFRAASMHRAASFRKSKSLRELYVRQISQHNSFTGSDSDSEEVPIIPGKAVRDSISSAFGSFLGSSFRISKQGENRCQERGKPGKQGKNVSFKTEEEQQHDEQTWRRRRVQFLQEESSALAAPSFQGSTGHSNLVGEDTKTGRSSCYHSKSHDVANRLLSDEMTTVSGCREAPSFGGSGKQGALALLQKHKDSWWEKSRNSTSREQREVAVASSIHQSKNAVRRFSHVSNAVAFLSEEEKHQEELYRYIDNDINVERTAEITGGWTNVKSDETSTASPIQGQRRRGSLGFHGRQKTIRDLNKRRQSIRMSLKLQDEVNAENEMGIFGYS